MKKLIMLVALVSFNLYAQGTDISEDNVKKVKCSMPCGPVQGSTGVVYSEGKFSSILKTIYVKKTDLYDGDTKLNNSKDKEMTSLVSNAIFRYGLGAGFDVRMIVPYVDKSMSNKSSDIDNSGIGDVRILSRYQLTSPRNGDRFFSAIGFGVELPTGSTDMPTSTSYGLRDGDGSTDPILEFGLTMPFSNSRLDFSTMYIFNQEGDDNYEEGDQFMYNLGYVYRVNSHFMPILELNGSVMDKNSANGKTLDSTGGHELFLTAGASTKVTSKLGLFIGVGTPIYRDLNTGNMGSDYRITTKIAYSWQ